VGAGAAVAACGNGGGTAGATPAGSGGGTTVADAAGVAGGAGVAPPNDDPPEGVADAADDRCAVSHNPHATPATVSSVLAFSSDERPCVR
jgi:hypothetical protein